LATDMLEIHSGALKKRISA